MSNKKKFIWQIWNLHIRKPPSQLGQVINLLGNYFLIKKCCASAFFWSIRVKCPCQRFAACHAPYRARIHCGSKPRMLDIDAWHVVHYGSSSFINYLTIKLCFKFKTCWRFPTHKEQVKMILKIWEFHWKKQQQLNNTCQSHFFAKKYFSIIKKKLLVNIVAIKSKKNSEWSTKLRRWFLLWSFVFHCLTL